eukprot:gene40923-50023_t
MATALGLPLWGPLGILLAMPHTTFRGGARAMPPPLSTMPSRLPNLRCRPLRAVPRAASARVSSGARLHALYHLSGHSCAARSGREATTQCCMLRGVRMQYGYKSSPSP